MMPIETTLAGDDAAGQRARLRRLRGYRSLAQLRIALQQVIMQGKEVLVA
jgi:hypothetical protein